MTPTTTRARGAGRRDTAAETTVDATWSDAPSHGSHNVAQPERIGSVVLGAALVTLALRRRDAEGMIAAALGGVFLLRGATGRCPVYRAMGMSTGSADAVLSRPRGDVTGRSATVNARRAVKIERNVTIDADREGLYEYWRDFTNLPRFMEHLVSVRVTSPTRSHWVSRAPAGTTVEWDAEIINELPGRLIAWKSLPGADVPNAGSVHFTDAPNGRGTVVKVEMDVEPPVGTLGLLIATMFGDDPDRDVREALGNLKQIFEGDEGDESGV